MPRLALIIVVLAALAAVIWSLSSDGADAPIPGGGAPTATDGPTESNVATLDAVDSAAGSAREIAGSSAAAATEVADDDTPRVQLTGRFVDGTGRPVPGLEVRYFTVARSDADNPFAALIRRARATDPDATTTSGDDGRFELAIVRGQEADLMLARRGTHLLTDAKDRRVTVPGSQRDVDLGDVAVRRSARVSGIVLDDVGQPVADAVVRVHLDLRRPRFPTPKKNEPTTATDGTFSVGGLDGGRHIVVVSAYGFVPARTTVELEAGGSRDGLRIELARGGQVTGRVVDDRGEAIPKARIAVFRTVPSASGRDLQSLDRENAAVTDEDGTFTLAGLDGTTVRLFANAANHADRTLEDVAVGSTVDVTLDRRAAIAGVLVDENGEGIEGSKVVVETPSTFRPGSRGSAPPGRATSTSIALPLVRSAARRGSNRPTVEPFVASGVVATTDATGTFRLEGVTPGRVRVRATGNGHLDAQSDELEVRVGESVEDLRLVAPPGASLEVVVRDASGDPIAGATVEALPDNAQRSTALASPFGGRRAMRRMLAGQAGGEATTNADGVCRLDGLPPQETLLFVEHDAFVPAEAVRAQPTLDTVRRVDVSLERGGFIDVTVVDADGAALSGTAIRVTGPMSDTGGDERPEQQDLSADADGNLAVGPLAAGRYELHVKSQLTTNPFAVMVSMQRGGPDPSLIAASRVETVVRTGERASVTLIRPTRAELTGRVVDRAGRPIAGATITAKERDANESQFGAPHSTKATGDGRYSIEGLAPGDWVVRFGSPALPARAEQIVTITPGAPRVEQDLVLATGSIAIRVQDADAQPLAAAKLRIQAVPLAQARPLASHAGRGPMMRGNPHATTDAAGQVTIDDVAVGEFTLEVHHPDHAPRLVGFTVREGERVELDTIRLERGGALVLTELALEGARRFEIRRAGSDLVERTAYGRATTSQRIERLPPGDYELRELGRGNVIDSADAPVHAFTIRAGEETVLRIDG